MPTLPQGAGRALRRVRNGVLVAAGLYLLAGFLVLHLQPAPRATAATATTEIHPYHRVIRGALSVHSERSHDAEGTFQEVARAARKAGLDFVVLGDHPGEWTEQGPSALDPVRSDGVLLVPGLELPVSGVGRTLVVGLDTVPRRWEGDVASLSSRVTRNGGFISVVHPRSPLAREDWEGLEAPGVHAWESFDISEMARTRLQGRWAPYHLTSFLAGLAGGGGQGALAGLWRKSTTTPALASFDSIRAAAPVVLTGGLNHHPKARFGSVIFPAYGPFFRTVVNHAVVPEPLRTDPVQARTQVLGALRRGNLFVTLGGGGEAESFCLHGVTPGGVSAEMGGATGFQPGARLQMRIPDQLRGRPLIRVLRGSDEVAWLQAEEGQVVEWTVSQPGVYRVEIFRAGPRLGPVHLGLSPWIISNPVEFYGPSP